MAITSLLKRLGKTLPAILAAAPDAIDAVRQVKQAFRKPKKPAGTGAEGVAASGSAAAPERLSADSGRSAR
jgi:hypothetical protein